MATAGDPIVVAAGERGRGGLSESGRATLADGSSGARVGLRRGIDAVALVHPGPSLLVTAVTVATGGLAYAALPPRDLVLRLVLIMLPAQFAIGAANDLADLEADRASKPRKPLACGAVSRHTALGVVVICTAVSLGAGASAGVAALAAVIVGVGAGFAYDLGLKRSPLSVLTWWAGLAALPLCAYAVAGAFEARLLWVIPLAGLLAVALLWANALPDLDADRVAGVDSLPVRLGAASTRRVGLAAAFAAALLATALIRSLGQEPPALLVAAAGFAAASALTLGNRSVRRPFPFVATAAAALAVAWFATLPR